MYGHIMIMESSVGDGNCTHIINCSLNLFSNGATCRGASIVAPAIINSFFLRIKQKETAN